MLAVGFFPWSIVLAAVVAHEVRNPLAGIRGALQVIGNRMKPEQPERAVVSEIVTRVDTLNAIQHDSKFDIGS